MYVKGQSSKRKHPLVL